MSRASVRAQIAEYLSPPNVPGLTTVFPADPLRIEGTDWPLENDTTGGSYGAAAFVHFDRTDRRRIAIGGAHGGIKMVPYTIRLMVVFRYVPGEDDTVTGWADAHDQVLDAVVARIEADRTFGSTNGVPLWQAGEGTPDGDLGDITTESDPPRFDEGEGGGQVEVWSAVTFTAIEMVAT